MFFSTTTFGEFLFLSALSFFFGVTPKLADGHHEHGLYFFTGAGVVFGALAGGAAFYLIGYSPVLQAAYLGPLLYWFYKGGVSAILLSYQQGQRAANHHAGSGTGPRDAEAGAPQRGACPVWLRIRRGLK